MPGTDVREATRIILGELPDFPHLPELPARGAGAELTGRSAALLVDLHVEVQPSGWRIAAAGGRDERRATAWLGEDLDTLEELAQGWTGPLKVQVCGPWTLAATIELHYGDKLLADPGACRDLVASLAEGIAGHVDEVVRRLPGTRLVLQLDEPALPGVLAGSVPTASGFGQLAAVDSDIVVAGLRSVLEAARHASAQASVIHCCAAHVPIDALVRSGASAISLDFGLLLEVADDACGVALGEGVGFLPGIKDLSDPAASVAPVRAWWNRLGQDPEQLATLVLTPSCGLAAASPASARRALASVREAARRLADDPFGKIS
jgi:hypothetical protein